MDHKLQIILAAKDVSGTALKRFRGRIASITKSVFSLRGAITTLTGAGGIGLLSKIAITAASDLQEITSKYNVVFGAMTVDVNEWVKNLVAGYAMSTSEARKYLSEMQDLLVPMGMNATAAADMSNEVVKLAADLGSFNNLKTQDVMRDIQSALVGNFETMKKYGVVLNQTVITQKAMDMGLISNKRELNASMRAQVAYNLIVKGSRFAIGDMERTFGSYANQLKKAKSNIVDMSASIGKSLLPAATEIVTNFNEWIDSNQQLIQQDIPGYIKKIGTAAAETAKIMLDVNDWMNKTIGGVVESTRKQYIDDLERTQKAVLFSIDQLARSNTPFGIMEESLKRLIKRHKELTVEIKLAKESWMDAALYQAFGDVDKASAALRNKKITGGNGGNGGGSSDVVPAANNYGFLSETDTAYRMSRAGGVFRGYESMEKASKQTFEAMDSHVTAYYDNLEKQSEKSAAMFDDAAGRMSGAIADFAVTGKFAFKDFAMSVIHDLIQIQTKALLTKIFQTASSGTGSWFSGFGTAEAMGGVYAPAGRMKFARGGVVRSPTVFPFAGGVGLMGEAGPEAIMPLTRTGSGELGVKSKGGGGNNYFYISAVDAKSVEDMLRRSGAVPMLAAESLNDNGLLRKAMLENL